MTKKKVLFMYLLILCVGLIHCGKSEKLMAELPSGYTNAWTNSLGEYILSDSPSFNPNIGSNLNWQRIERK